MRVAAFFGGLGIFWMLILISGCQEKKGHDADFTRADSLTDTYLSLQDTMLQVWNTMIHDDNRKIQAMHQLLRELRITDPGKSDEIDHYEERLEALGAMRYDQQSISDPEVVTEYDFASNALVAELISVAESQPRFAYNVNMQKLVDSIRSADQRVLNYRIEYDEVASRFNRFIEQHHEELEELSTDSIAGTKPLFQMAAE